MYTLELNLRFSPFPITVQKKEYVDVKNIYDQIKDFMNDNTNKAPYIELNCDKVQDKLVSVLTKEILSVQIYEKSAVAGGSKRPGFSLDI